MKRHPDPQPDRRPVETITVECGRTGPEEIAGECDIYRSYTIADLEAFCAELRRLGAGDDLALPQAEGLVVTMNVR